MEKFLGRYLPQSVDLRAGLAAIATLLVGALVVAILPSKAQGAPTTSLLVISVIVYALASGRLLEFSAPGGWKAKFREVASRTVGDSAGVIDPSKLPLELLPKDDPPKLDEAIKRARNELVVVLTMIFGGQAYEQYALGKALDLLSQRRSFKALVILSETGKLIAYSPARQAILYDPNEDTDGLVSSIKSGPITKIESNVLMTTEAVRPGATYLHALERMDKKDLPCLAVTDEDGVFRGLVERERIIATLLSTLARGSTAS